MGSDLSYGQNRTREKKPNPRNIATYSQAAVKTEPIPLDSLPQNVRDSLKAVADSTHRADSLFRADSTALAGKSSLDFPAFTAARDSIVESFVDGQQIIYYYGDVSVTYGTMKLTADYMEYNLNTGELYAHGSTDENGEPVGDPVMEDGGKKYTMKVVRYNFNSRKARLTEIISSEADGILHGKNVKMEPYQSINITKGKYTVCDADEPHYYLALTAAKVITKPNQKTVFGPAYPVIAGVPLPVAIPFGFIPQFPERSTGILIPTLGEEQARGFFMRDGGFYLVFGEYFDLSVTGDIYTLGSWAINVNSRYKVNYKFSGSFSVNYSNDQTGEKGSPDFFKSSNFGVKWSHSQDPKAHPGQSFSASVNFSSPSNSQYNSQSITEALQNQISSSISFSRNWNGKINLSVNALHSQNSRDSSYAFTLPNITFSVSRFYPFKKKVRVGKEKFYEKFSFGYSTTIQNKINFKAKEFNQPGFWEKFNNGMTHNFQIGLPSFDLFKYINISPNISYGMNWYFNKTEKVYNADTGKVEDVKAGAFKHFGVTHTYSGSISMSTRIYGMFNFGKASSLQAIRHVITPSLSFNFSPDKAKAFNGWRTLDYVDKEGKPQSIDYNIYQGSIYSPPGKGSTAALSLSIGNNLEAKVRSLRDTTGKGVKKIKLLDQLNLSTGYNFLADSLKLNNIGITVSTSIFGKLSISGNLNLDPYAIDGDGRKINKFNVTQTGHLVRLTNASFSTSYSFSGKGKIEGNDGREASANYYQKIYYHPVTGEYIPGGWTYYTNPDVPWSLNLSYSFSYSRAYQKSNGQLITKHNYNQTLQINGNVKIAPGFSISVTSGVDLMALKLTTTQISATYDMHCFNMSISWVPNGKWESYSFRIAANAAALADLLRIKKSNSYWDK
ncbi:MAG: LPS-assembly protein LptD [Bacteroidales bacterium]|nr:LPS-assembly protein LptD [Bacteroidales bacterium]